MVPNSHLLSPSFLKLGSGWQEVSLPVQHPGYPHFSQSSPGKKQADWRILPTLHPPAPPRFEVAELASVCRAWSSAFRSSQVRTIKVLDHLTEYWLQSPACKPPDQGSPAVTSLSFWKPSMARSEHLPFASLSVIVSSFSKLQDAFSSVASSARGWGWG